MTNPTPTTGIDLDGLEKPARGESGAKSLGEKLHDAARPVWAGRDWHNDSSADVQAEYERVALAFAASLTHDETANAATLSLISALRASQQVAKEQAETITALVEATERLERNFYLVLAGKPVRDVAETKTEVRAALSRTRPSGGGE